MPHVGGDVNPARKRRWEDEENDVYRLYDKDDAAQYYVLNQAQDHPSRKVIPLSKRARIADDELRIHNDFTPGHRRRPSQQQKAFHDQQQPCVGSRAPVKSSSSALAPCYICHRRPTKKSDLDSFAECQGCGERTCYVCIRECQGWDIDDRSSVLFEQEVLSRSFHMDDADAVPSERDTNDHAKDHHKESQQETPKHQHPAKATGHRNKKGWVATGHRNVVCSRCCVERGIEGDVTCLGCLSGLEGA